MWSVDLALSNWVHAAPDRGILLWATAMMTWHYLEDPKAAEPDLTAAAAEVPAWLLGRLEGDQVACREAAAVSRKRKPSVAAAPEYTDEAVAHGTVASPVGWTRDWFEAHALGATAANHHPPGTLTTEVAQRAYAHPTTPRAIREAADPLAPSSLPSSHPRSNGTTLSIAAALTAGLFTGLLVYRDPRLNGPPSERAWIAMTWVTSATIAGNFGDEWLRWGVAAAFTAIAVGTGGRPALVMDQLIHLDPDTEKPLRRRRATGLILGLVTVCVVVAVMP